MEVAILVVELAAAVGMAVMAVVENLEEGVTAAAASVVELAAAVGEMLAMVEEDLEEGVTAAVVFVVELAAAVGVMLVMVEEDLEEGVTAAVVFVVELAAAVGVMLVMVEEDLEEEGGLVGAWVVVEMVSAERAYGGRVGCMEETSLSRRTILKWLLCQCMCRGTERTIQGHNFRST